jgi:hypothetical protein
MSDVPPILPKFDPETWHDRLLRSLRECGTQPSPKYILLRYFFVGLVVVAFAAIGKLFEYVAKDAIEHQAPPLIVAACRFAFAIFAVAVLSRIRNALIRNVWRASARNAERELMRSNARRPVFYLRSFAMDKVLSRRSWLERYLGIFPLANTEQRVTSKLRKIGPVIAIGRPGEKLPQLGAARFYVSNELWQQKVGEVVVESQLVLWMSGLTNGLGWELEHLIGRLKPERFLLWAHPHLLGLSEARREEEWRAFLAKFGKHFPKPLPERLGDARYFVFAEDWTPLPCAPRMSAIFAMPEISALTRALKIREEGCRPETLSVLKELSENRNCRYFGDVVGVRKVERDWPRAVAFAIAASLTTLVAFRLSELIRTREMPKLSFGGIANESMSVLIGNLIYLGIFAIVFRFIRHSLPAIAIGWGAMQLISWVRGYGLTLVGWAQSVFDDACLALAIRLSNRLLVGLFLGTFAGSFFWACFRNAQQRLVENFGADLSRLPWGEYLDFMMTDMLNRWPLAFMSEASRAVLFTVTFCIGLKVLPLFSRKLD